jgi:hypothetical protein
VVVALPDRFRCLIESINGGGAANGDEGLFFYSAPQLSEALFFEEFAAKLR